MRLKVVLAATILALAASSFAAPPSCEILLPQSTRAGTATLEPGQYRVEVEGSEAVLTNVVTGHAFTAAVRVETTKSHADPAVAVDNRGGTRFLKSIELP